MLRGLAGMLLVCGLAGAEGTVADARMALAAAERGKAAAILRPLARAGDAEALALLRSIPPEPWADGVHASGREFLEAGDTRQALPLLQRAADEGRHAEAALALGELYGTGRRVSADQDRAGRWFARALERGATDAVVAYARSRMGGEQPNCRLAAHLLMTVATYDPSRWEAEQTRLADEAARGNAAATLVLGNVAQLDEPRRGGDFLLYTWIAADAGLPEARYRMGNTLLASEHASDRKTGVAWIEQAAAAGYADAQSLVGSWYLNGSDNVKKDPKRGFVWVEKAAAQGVPVAISLLGLCYGQGLGVEQDYVRSVAILRRAAGLEHAMGQMFLGIFLVTGKGVEKDEVAGWNLIGRAAATGYELARKLVEDKAKAGIAGALHQIGLLTLPEDEAEGRKLIRQAADKGWAPAQAWLKEHGK